MKHAAKPPISEMTRPISGMKRARMSVRQNQTSVCTILRLCSLATSVSTSSPLKRNHKPSSTALPQKCRIGYEVTTQMMMKARAMATATSLDGYDINTSWLTLEPNDRKPQTPVPVYTKRQMIMLTVTTAHQGRISGFFMLLKTGTLLT